MRLQSMRAPRHALTGLVAASILATAGVTAACDSTGGQSQVVGPEYLGICVSPVTGLRVPDYQCCAAGSTGLALDTAGYYWDYIDTYRYGGPVVAVGYAVPRTVVVVRTLPARASVNRSVPAVGGTSATSLRTSLAKTSSGGNAGASPAGTAKTAPKAGSSSIVRGGFGVPAGASSNGGSSSGPRSYSGGS